HAGGIPDGFAVDPADHFSVAIDQKTRRQAFDVEGPADGALWVEIDFDRFEPELDDKRVDRLGAATILGDRDHGQLVVELVLQAFERRHLLDAGCAPGGPKIDEHGLSSEGPEVDAATLTVGKGHLGHRLRRRYRDEFAELVRV